MTFLLTLAMVAGLLPGMSLTAYADTFYGDYLVTDSDTSQTLQNKIVHFNDKEWYIIADASAAANEGTLTLFAKDPIDTSRFNEKLDEGNAYNGSKIKGYLDGLTTGDGSFAGMADVIVPTDLTDVNVTGAKLYLLSREEAKALCNDVRKCLSVPGTIEKKWWLRSSSSGNSNAVAYVDGKTGDVDGYGHNLIAEFGVRPALNLDLSKVTFDSTTSTFSLPTTYPLWVGGVQVASGNRSGDGWRYDATNNTLTLNGFSYEGSADGIFYDGNNDLTIELTGTNTITTAGEVNHGIEISTIADLTLLGTGSLSVDCPDALAIYSASVFSNITFKSGTVTAQGSNGISVQGNIIIEGGTVNASATGENGYGIQSKEGSVEISSGNVIAAGKKQAIVGNVKNAVPGVGWSNTEGTQGKADIAVSETGRSLPHKKVQFLAPIAKLPQTAPAVPVSDQPVAFKNLGLRVALEPDFCYTLNDFID